jgi:hypothetical protein
MAIGADHHRIEMSIPRTQWIQLPRRRQRIAVTARV